MDWSNGGSFGQNELYGELGELREEEVEELRSERTIKSGLKVGFNALLFDSNPRRPKRRVHFPNNYKLLLLYCCFLLYAFVVCRRDRTTDRG